MADAGRSYPSASENGLNGEGIRHRQTGADAATNKTNHSTEAPDGSTVPEFTTEQLADIQRIKNCRTHYEVLSIARSTNDGELIKKTYRLLAIRFHPDKNRAPGATDAFKAIGNAYSTLSDAEKRKKYDDNLDNERAQPPEVHLTKEQLEELFRRQFPETRFAFTPADEREAENARGYRPPQFYQTEPPRRVTGGDVCCGLVIIWVVFMMVGLYVTNTTEPTYAFEKSSCNMLCLLLHGRTASCIDGQFVKPGSSPAPDAQWIYSVHRVTQVYNVSYYVRRGFSNKFYGRSLVKLEAEIEEKRIAFLRNGCNIERQKGEQLRYRVAWQSDGKSRLQAMKADMPTCDTLTSRGIRLQVP